MAFLCPSRPGRSKEKKQKVPFLGRITGSASIDTLVRVGLEKQHGLKPDSKMVVINDFLPCADNELKIEKGQEVFLLYIENGWAYIISEGQKEGFVPASFLLPYKTYKRRSMLSNHENDFTMWEIEEDDEGEDEDEDDSEKIRDINFGDVQEFVKTPNNDKYVVLYDFQIVNENDINVKRGEIVSVLNSDDNDWSWICKANNQQGFIPLSFIYLLPKHLNTTVEDDKVDKPPPLPPRDYKPINIHNANIWGVYQNNHTKTIQKIPLKSDSRMSMKSNTAKNTTNLLQCAKNKVVEKKNLESAAAKERTNEQAIVRPPDQPIKNCWQSQETNLEKLPLSEASSTRRESIQSDKGSEIDKTKERDFQARNVSVRQSVRNNSSNLSDQSGIVRDKPNSCLVKNSDALKNVKPNTPSLPKSTVTFKTSHQVLEKKVSSDKPSSPNFIKKVIISDYQSKTQPFLSVKKGEIVFIDYNNQTNSTWLWVYSPNSNMYGNVPVSLLQDVHNTEHRKSQIALV